MGLCGGCSRRSPFVAAKDPRGRQESERGVKVESRAEDGGGATGDGGARSDGGRAGFGFAVTGSGDWRLRSNISWAEDRSGGYGGGDGGEGGWGESYYYVIGVVAKSHGHAIATGSEEEKLHAGCHGGLHGEKLQIAAHIGQNQEKHEETKTYSYERRGGFPLQSASGESAGQRGGGPGGGGEAS